jgi:acyl-CoA thioesterase
MSTADDAHTDTARRHAERMYADDKASQALGIEVLHIATGTATVRMLVRPDMVNGYRIAHGGYVFLLADTAFALACNTYGPVTVARSCEIEFVRPVKEGEQLTATAQERLRVRRNGIYDIRVCGAGGDVVAEMRGHSRTLSDRST